MFVLQLKTNRIFYEHILIVKRNGATPLFHWTGLEAVMPRTQIKEMLITFK